MYEAKQIDNLSIAYQKKGNGPVLLFLHGFTVDSRMWQPQIEKLSQQFTVIAWDAPGAGQSSDPPEGFTLSDWAKCLEKLLNSLEIRSAHMIGLSWGGILAQQYYSQFPKRIKSMILADTYAGWVGSLPREELNTRVSAVLHDAVLPVDKFVSKYLPSMFSENPPKEVQENFKKVMKDFHPVGFRLMASDLSGVDTRKIFACYKSACITYMG